MSKKSKNLFQAKQKADDAARVTEFAQQVTSQIAVEKEATAVIYAAVKKWTGEEVSEQTAIPMYRDGKRQSEFDDTILGHGSTVRDLVRLSRFSSKSELKRDIQHAEYLAELTENLWSALHELDPENFYGLDNIQDETKTSSLEQRIIKQIGYTQSVMIASSVLNSKLRKQILRLNERLNSLDIKKGRTRDEAAYSVALGLAKLYAKVTGKQPTYSENKSGLSGEFTPVLRDLFDALGWVGRSLKGPATEAVRAIDLTNSEYVITTPGWGLLGVKRK